MNFSDYANLPIEPPPPGIVPNFDHPHRRVIILYAGVGVCLGITLVFVLLRIYSKLAVTHTWGWDDGACLMGFGFIAAYDGVNWWQAAAGHPIGTHVWDIQLKDTKKIAFQGLIANFDLYSAAAFFSKLSIMLFYLRLFKLDKVTRWLVYGGILATGLFYSVVSIIYTVLQSPPLDQPQTDILWMTQSLKHMAFSKNLVVMQGVYGALSDIYLLVIPIRSIFQLHLPFRRKLGISSIFLIGILALACSVTSVYYRVKFYHTKDLTWYTASLYTFANADICAGIICNCMPIINVLFGGKAAHKSPFAPVAALFSRLGLCIFRQPFMSRYSLSLERLNPIQVKNYAKAKLKERNKLDGGIGVMNSNEAV